tara:strand:- start:107 stop:409 length:303 start_codon:yes stop_codon:yes gene_type:complete
MARIIQEELNEIKLSVGDIIVQYSSGFVGILVQRFRNTPSLQNVDNRVLAELWFWRVQWLKNIDRGIDIQNAPFLNETLEEEGLKMAIFIGNIEHYNNTP